MATACALLIEQMIAVGGTRGNDIRHTARFGCRATQLTPNFPNRPMNK
jgi:hypothetical protein